MATLTFMMGNHPAELPGELLYCRNHMWCREAGAGTRRFGFSAYALRLMQDVYFLDWCVATGDAIRLKQPIGNIETSKAVSDLFSPIAGTMGEINRDALKDPSAINADCYGRGWLFEMGGDAGDCMTAQGYYDFLEKGWENTQRILKGQMGD